MSDTTIIPIDSIDNYNKMYGFETLHPLVSVVDLAEATKIPNHVTFRYGVYALWLKDGIQCALHYGRQQYDYRDGTIVSFAPGQMVRVDMTEEQLRTPSHTLRTPLPSRPALWHALGEDDRKLPLFRLRLSRVTPSQ